MSERPSVTGTGWWRKKPVVIEAHRMPQHFVIGLARPYLRELARWCGGEEQADGSIVIPTLEGDHRADPGDYIIKGVKGEFYPCKPDIFAATYEPAEPPPPDAAPQPEGT